MKNTTRNTTNEEKNHAMKRDISTSGDHNSNNNDRKYKLNTCYSNDFKRKYHKVTLNIIKQERTKKGLFFINLWEMCVSDTPVPVKSIAENIRR